MKNENIENTVNYIVAIYGGARRAYGDFSPIEVFLERQIEFLLKNPKYIEYVTFVFNKSDNPQEERSIKKCNDFLANSRYKGKVLVRENKDASYGAWNDSLIETHQNTTHSFLIEDDYIPSRLDFLDFFLSKDSPEISFVASYYYNNHASISNGLINNEKVKKKLSEDNSLFLLSGNNSYSGFFQNREFFLTPIEGVITDITDIGHTLFFDSDKSNIVFTNDSLPKLIEPISLNNEGDSNYLVIFSAHVDSERKKNEIVKTLKHLKESSVDVCLSTHSNLYLSELSQYVKYVIYDDNNEFLTLQDYIDNSKYINEDLEYGYSKHESFHGFGSVIIKMPGSPHSKSALTLFRNGLIISQLNNYKWTIYLEYDIEIPKLGFKDFFDLHVNRLISEGKKCFHYNNISDRLNFLWGGFFLFQTNYIFDNEKFMKKDWYSTKQKWIREWNIGFFESILDYIVRSSFRSDEIATDIIQDKYKEFWDAENLSEIDKFGYQESSHVKNKYLKNNFEIHLYPYIDSNNKKLFLYYYNCGEQKVTLDKILVYSDRILHMNKKDVTAHVYGWSFEPIEITSLENDDTVILSWEGSVGKESYSHTESIKIEDLESVYKKTMSIKFN
jgi:hypothetical protein